jgi:hypothetical protein
LLLTSRCQAAAHSWVALPKTVHIIDSSIAVVEQNIHWLRGEVALTLACNHSAGLFHLSKCQICIGAITSRAVHTSRLHVS